MRITVLSNRDLPSCVALNHLLPQLTEHEVCVFLSAQVGSAKAQSGNGENGSKATPEALRQLKFFEQDLFNQVVFPLAEAALQAAENAAQPELLTFRGLEKSLSGSIEELNDINGAGLERFRASTPDLVLSIRYGVILREAAIAVPPQGVLNLHSGLLPEYRGVMASFRALQAGDAELFTTLHTIDDPGIDTGRILGYSPLARDPGKSYFWHVLKLYRGGCEKLAEAVQKISAGEVLEGTPQASLAKSGAYYSFPNQHELDAFYASGLRLVDTEEITELARRFSHER